MSLAAAPPAGAGTRPAPRTGLAVTKAVHRTFGRGTTALGQDAERRFFPSHTGHAGVALREELLDTAVGNTFEHMGAELLAELGEQPETDLVVLAYSTPDFLPTLLTAPTLTERLPGRPLLLGVADQGPSAPFSALALARNYARRHGFRRVLVLAFDQHVMPYDVPGSGPRGLAGDGAVALVLEASGDNCRVRQICGLSPQEVPERLAALIRELDPEGTAEVAAGPGIDPAWKLPVAAASVRRAPEGYPCTSVLGALAERLPAAGGGAALLVEYDPVLGDLSVCRVDPAAAA
ncbi:hypothetical protein GCM10010497_55280 [Streptomyces cinereoruber]|uniref:Uncharacterized protein n=1 Tax=Streptomyces cinereoruber TaxID=67260 RepID=A0AAV4KPC8_9ACTN|nr:MULTISPECIES: hypothetical protein [unclassified Streptomyces]AVH96791.1 hypothetical protein C5L38_18390 [Streptomyces sp. WAC00288]GGR44803.1 hypothetical protein GCM10010497_55280 [Streptomyces cinereoruber]